MAESVVFTKSENRAEIYAEITPQIEALIAVENDLIANLANVAAVLKEVFGFFWVGFYLAKDGQLILGPFQGPVACTRIGLDQGVCGHAYTTRDTVIVPNVDEFPGHIACSSASRSEIVVPVFDRDRNVFAVLDVDSDKLDDFSPIDADGFRKVADIISNTLN